MSVYWKIGIGLEDVSLGQKRILAKGVQITEPHQFQEIGFLCHLKDGAGFSLELLQVNPFYWLNFSHVTK